MVLIILAVAVVEMVMALIQVLVDQVLLSLDI